MPSSHGHLANLTTSSYSTTKQHQSCMQSSCCTAATNAACNTMMRAVCCIGHWNRVFSKSALPFPILVLLVNPAADEAPWRLHYMRIPHCHCPCLRNMLLHLMSVPMLSVCPWPFQLPRSMMLQPLIQQDRQGWQHS